MQLREKTIQQPIHNHRRENPTLDAYLKYLEDGKTDYYSVLEEDAKQGKLMMRKSAKKRALK